MECYTRADDFFGEAERFITTHRKNGNIREHDSRASHAQAVHIKGCNEANEQVWNSDYNFARTAGAVMRTLMLAATKIPTTVGRLPPGYRFVSLSSIATRRNDQVLEFVDDQHPGGMPCPAENIHQAMDINGQYACRFNHRIMNDVQMRGMEMNVSRFLTETMIIIKPGEDQIEFWYIISTLRVIKQLNQEDIPIYNAVPMVAVIYLRGNQAARDAWRRDAIQPDEDMLQQLMEQLNIGGALRERMENLRAPEGQAGV